MARAMNTTANQRYRAVVKVKKIGPVYDAAWRDDARQRSYIQSNMQYWLDSWAEDDRTVGEITEEVIGHYDTITPVKQAVNKYVKRLNKAYVVLDIQFQVAPLIWQVCDDKGN